MCAVCCAVCFGCRPSGKICAVCGQRAPGHWSNGTNAAAQQHVHVQTFTALDAAQRRASARSAASSRQKERAVFPSRCIEGALALSTCVVAEPFALRARFVFTGELGRFVLCRTVRRRGWCGGCVKLLFCFLLSLISLSRQAERLKAAALFVPVLEANCCIFSRRSLPASFGFSGNRFNATFESY